VKKHVYALKWFERKQTHDPVRDIMITDLPVTSKRRLLQKLRKDIKKRLKRKHHDLRDTTLFFGEGIIEQIYTALKELDMVKTEYAFGTPKRDASGKGVRTNQGRNPICVVTEVSGRGRRPHTPIVSEQQRKLFGVELTARKKGKTGPLPNISLQVLEAHLKESARKRLPIRKVKYAFEDILARQIKDSLRGSSSLVAKVPIKRKFIQGVKQSTKVVGRIGLTSAKGAGRGLLTGLAFFCAATLLRSLQRKAARSSIDFPLPTIRTDVEFTPTYKMHYALAAVGTGLEADSLKIIGVTAQNAKNLSTGVLSKIRTKLAYTVRRVEKGALYTLLIFYLGLVTSELLGRGISRKTSTRAKPEKYRFGEVLSTRLSQTRKVKSLTKPGTKSFIKKRLPMLKKVGKGIGKASNIAFTAWLVSDLVKAVRAKKKEPTIPSTPYSLQYSTFMWPAVKKILRMNREAVSRLGHRGVASSVTRTRVSEPKMRKLLNDLLKGKSKPSVLASIDEIYGGVLSHQALASAASREAALRLRLAGAINLSKGTVRKTEAAIVAKKEALRKLSLRKKLAIGGGAGTAGTIAAAEQVGEKRIKKRIKKAVQQEEEYSSKSAFIRRVLDRKRTIVKIGQKTRRAKRLKVIKRNIKIGALGSIPIIASGVLAIKQRQKKEKLKRRILQEVED